MRSPGMMFVGLSIVAATISASTDPEVPWSDSAERKTPTFAHLKAPDAVRQGNRLLLADKPVAALEAYGHAKELEPHAREIDFVRGLAYFKLGAYDEAREAFENAATSSRPSLVDDAIYGIGTTYHAKALRNAGSLQEAIAQLEQAMLQYHAVLAHQPDHKAAGEANHKAALIWRSLKEQLRQRQQQDQCDNEGNQKPQQRHHDSPQNQSQHDQEQKDANQQQSPSPQTDAPEQEHGPREPRQTRQSRDEHASREQAERKLREMMQALRHREKQRRKRVQPVPVVPVEKDW